MKIRNILLISVAVFLLQTTLIQNFRIAGIIPNLNLILIVLLIINLDLKEVLYYSAFAGILQDIYVSNMLGKNLLLYLVISAIIINFESIFNKDSIFSPLFLISITTFSYHILNYLIMNFTGQTVIVYSLFNILIIETVMNILIIIPIYLVNRKRVIL